MTTFVTYAYPSTHDSLTDLLYRCVNCGNRSVIRDCSSSLGQLFRLGGSSLDQIVYIVPLLWYTSFLFASLEIRMTLVSLIMYTHWAYIM